SAKRWCRGACRPTGSRATGRSSCRNAARCPERGSARHTLEDRSLPAVEALGEARGGVRLDPAQTHERPERVPVEPLVAGLRRKRTHQVLDLAPRDALREGDVDIRRAEVPVVLRDLVLEDQVVAEGVSRELRKQPVILVGVALPWAEDQVGRGTALQALELFLDP